MEDFAAAAMMRLIALGARRLGLALPLAAAPAGARVPLPDKRRLLEALLQEHGPGVVLRLGEGVFDARDEPALIALCGARTPPELLQRWQRLERFVHSRHRIQVDALPGAARVRHVSMREGEPPHTAEDLLVVGVLVALMARCGFGGVQARPASRRAWSYDEGRWATGGLAGADSSTWDFAWSGGGPHTVDTRQRPAGAGDWASRAAAAIEQDPARAWQLQELAHDLGLAPRSLQRHLQRQGQRFSQVLLEARVARAAQMLAGSTQPPAQVGYICGFADQAHFTRSFKRQSGLTPAAWRAHFMQPPQGAAQRRPNACAQ